MSAKEKEAAQDKCPFEEKRKALRRPVHVVAEHHVDSFNFFLEHGLARLLQRLDPLDIELKVPRRGGAKDDLATHHMKLWVVEAELGQPCERQSGTWESNRKVYPRTCRQMRTTYASPLWLSIARQVDNGEVEVSKKFMGTFPMMVMSNKCNLKIERMSDEQLKAKGEEEGEMGAYFIINGNEKLIRIITSYRSNYPFALSSTRFLKRGRGFTEHAIQVRCMRDDLTSQTNSIHYSLDGTCSLRVVMGKLEFFLPVILALKAFAPCTDREIFEKLTRGSKDPFVADRVEIMIRSASNMPWRTQQECLSYLGARFRSIFRYQARSSDLEVGEYVVRSYLFVHLDTFRDKFAFLVHCVLKLFALVRGDVKPDNLDATSNHELLLPGQVYGTLLKEKFRKWMEQLAAKMVQMAAGRGLTKSKITEEDIFTEGFFKRAMERAGRVDQRMEYFLATGNVMADSSLDFMQKTGFVIMAEKLNHLRYISHYKAVHRGQYFTTMKTTQVRKLLPESWGFLCPVHTPDGSPCGLLNHMSQSCVVTTSASQESPGGTEAALLALGMQPEEWPTPPGPAAIPVLLNGRVVGHLAPQLAHKVERQLRVFKAKRMRGIPSCLEISLIDGKWSPQFPSLELQTTLCRMMRPVHNLSTNSVEYIGSLEQIYLNIACTRGEIDIHKHTHVEVDPTSMLSIIASMTPFSDFNQSPRNMYQCQMGKQTMAIPCHSIAERVDNKMYRIVTPQNPIVCTGAQEQYQMNEYPMGTNAVVAVISYTGYDMEDAMIIHRGSSDRGFAHGFVYKTKIICPAEKSGGMSRFGNPIAKDGLKWSTLDEDGLPFCGDLLENGSPFYATLEGTALKPTIHLYRGEECRVDTIRVIGHKGDKKGIETVVLTLRYVRNPIIGDKFSSRHGQKGVLSKLWGSEDMPFSESGMVPDVIINPHAFPSRMTIGMLIESMAGKSGALHGIKQDATPFTFDEKQRVVDFFGEQLVTAGYQHYGNEPLYSGISGEPMESDIFIGLVYYQRLRHMVSDKYQVRSTGPINELTHQPVKGRKMGGGIRVGEMERDSMLAHGATFVLHDRLMNCSDTHNAEVCVTCGSFLGITSIQSGGGRRVSVCLFCGDLSAIQVVALPFVFRYLCNELAAMNVRVRLVLKDAYELKH
eukprot:TRINITY_DN8364_c1_g1_i1.p1 TRINITY_DN8364_c1_g1~~TRINITY_DN8364_c1_g1_i1.p1  ORF type:complete len:1149 (-),score=395.42 TRINITY_DN8364_c1_g1_i1:341-3787(-)